MLRINRKLFIVIIFLIFIVLTVIAIIISSIGHKKKKIDLDSGRYYDKNSGQTVSNPNGKGPDNYGIPAGQPVFLGINKLLDSGVSIDQITELKYAFTNYSTQSGGNIKEVSIDENSIGSTEHIPNTANFSVEFNVTFNRKETLHAKVEYSHQKNIQLHLYNQQSGVEVYNSSPINNNTGD